MHPCSTRFRFTAPSAKVWLTLASIALTSALNTACASFGEREPVVPSLIGTLPETIASFQFDGYKHFDDSSGGFSFRYRNVAKKRLADVYVYPVAKQNAGLAHEELVLGSTRATIEAITEAVNQGHYANFDLLGAATRAQGARTTARVHATYLRDNLASFTMLYQSEHEGTLMKIRLSMPCPPSYGRHPARLRPAEYRPLHISAQPSTRTRRGFGSRPATTCWPSPSPDAQKFVAQTIT